MECVWFSSECLTCWCLKFTPHFLRTQPTITVPFFFVCMRTTVWAFREIYSLPVVISTNFVLLCFLFSCFVLLWRLVRQGSFVEISWQSSGSSVCQLTQELQALVLKPSNPGSRSYETTSHSFLPDIAYTLLQVEWLATWLISVAKSFRGHDFGRKRLMWVAN